MLWARGKTFVLLCGSGLKKIIENYKSEEHYRDELIPVFESTHSSFFVTLKNLNYNVGRDVGKENNENQGFDKSVTDNVGENVTDIPDKKLSRAERLIEIVKILSEKPETTVAELSDRLFVVERTINRDIKKLQEDGFIERVGSDTKGYWRILKQ